MKKIKLNFLFTAVLFMLFALLIVALFTVDVQPIGPQDSVVGLSKINSAVFNFFGVNLIWYHITDWISLGAIAVAFGFSVLGLVQLIKRKSLKKVDKNLLLLGLFYLSVIGFYILFEFAVVNYRPIILDGDLSASFPSSTTLIVVSIMGTAIIEFNYYFKNRRTLRITAVSLSVALTVITVVGRLISGVHWFTDILGGVLLGSALTMLYYLTLQYLSLKKV